MKFWNLILLEPSGSAQACNGIALPLPIYKVGHFAVAVEVAVFVLIAVYHCSSASLT
jgi:hypothetical protein